MSDTTGRNETPTMVPTQVTALSRGRSEQLRLTEARARQIAEDIALRQGWNHADIASSFMDVGRLPSHGQMISWRTAQEIGLENVRYMPRTDRLWRRYW